MKTAIQTRSDELQGVLQLAKEALNVGSKLYEQNYLRHAGVDCIELSRLAYKLSQKLLDYARELPYVVKAVAK